MSATRPSDSAAESDRGAVSSASDGAAETDEETNGVSSSPAPAAAEPAGPAPIGALLERAQKAQREWAKVSLRLRLRTMKKVEKRLLARIEDLANLVHEERGTPVEEAAITEVLANGRLFGAWRREAADRFEASVVELGQLTYPGKAGRIEREPLGVVALFASGSHPVAAPIRAIVPALMCGNAVVFQPSGDAPRTARAVAALFDDLVPAGTVTVLPAEGDLGETVLDCGVDLVLYAGERAAGARLGAACEARSVPCRLEIASKDAAIVLADADIERTARGLSWAAFHDAGRSGGALKRVVVVKSAAKALRERLEALAKELAGQLPFGPAVVDEPESSDAAAPGDDSQKPVLALSVVDDEDAAVTEVHRHRGARTISVWTKRVGYGRTFARRLRAGMVVVNNHAFGELLAEAPWTISGAAGWGTTDGASAIETLSRRKLVLTDRMVVKRETWWFPYTPALRAVSIAKSLLAGGRGLFGRLRGLVQLLVSLPKRMGEG
jgi:acyl-CoA reductase-like NAD-dependent aldehyde dehydrogenase